MSGIIGFALSLVIGAIFLHLAVKIAAGAQSTSAGFGQAIWVNLLLVVTTTILGMIPVLGFLLSIVAGFMILMGSYKIGFLRSLLVTIVYAFLVGGTAAVLVLIFGTALLAFLPFV